MRTYFDIDTQLDFLYGAGALYGKGGEALIGPVGALNRHAVKARISLISTMCAHSEEAAEFATWPPHCIRGTVGQTKPASLLVGKTVVVPNVAIEYSVAGAEQILLEKNDLDLFTNPNLAGLLRALGTTECFVYGAYTEYCVKCALFGLVKLGMKVSFVTDAASALDSAAGEKVIQKFVEAGGLLTKLEAAVSPER